MTKPTTETEIPLTITIGDQTYSTAETPELAGLISAAQQVIKKQQYSKITELTTKNAAMSQQITDLNNQLASAQRLTIPTMPTSPVAANPVPQPLPIHKPGDPVTPEQMENAKPHMFEQFMGTLQQLVPLVNDLTLKVTRMDADNLAQYRSQRLAELGNTVIPELVEGRTREEIDASIEKSKSILARHVPTPAPATVVTTPVATPVATPVRAANPNEPVVSSPAPLVIPAPQPRHLQPEEEAPIDVKKMSTEEYAKQREVLMGKLRTEVAQS